MTQQAYTRLNDEAITAAADRFREWTRKEEAVQILTGVCEGSLSAENDLIAAFITAVDGDDHA